MIPLCSRFDSVLFTPKMSAIASYGNYSRSPRVFSLCRNVSSTPLVCLARKLDKREYSRQMGSCPGKSRLINPPAQRSLSSEPQGRTILIWNGIPARWSPFFILATVTTVLAAGPTLAQSKPATYEGKAVRIGHGTAHTVVRTDTKGDLASIGIVFTPGMLDGLPKAAKDADPDFPYLLPMPTKGPRRSSITSSSAGSPLAIRRRTSTTCRILISI